MKRIIRINIKRNIKLEIEGQFKGWFVLARATQLGLSTENLMWMLKDLQSIQQIDE